MAKIELKSKRLRQRLIKQRGKGWGIQYFDWPYLSLFLVVWPLFVVVFLTLILCVSFSTDHDLVWSNVELHWLFMVFAGTCFLFFFFNNSCGVGSNEPLCLLNLDAGIKVFLSHSLMWICKTKIRTPFIKQGQVNKRALYASLLLTSLHLGHLNNETLRVITWCYGARIYAN